MNLKNVSTEVFTLPDSISLSDHLFDLKIVDKTSNSIKTKL